MVVRDRHIELILKAEGRAGYHRLRAGQELISARKHVPPGEWKAWCETNIKRSYRDIKRLLKIAGAEDPEAALEQERVSTRAQVARSRGDIRMSPASDPVDEHPRTPADLFASIKPALDAMSLDDLSEFSSHILHFIADRPAPIVAEVPLFDGDMPICNGSASTAHAEEYASVIDGVMFKSLNTRRAFSPFLDRSKIVLEARVRWNGWTAVAQVERKKTKAEIADFDAREKALAAYMDKLPPPVILDEAGRAAHPDLAAEYDSMMAADKAKAADRERLKLLRERAEKNGYRLVKRGDYRLIREDGTGSGGYPNLDSVEWRLDAVEGKIADQTCTPCGTPIPGWNNSEAGLAAHPGKTMEDFERALPPVESTCAAEAEPSPEVVATAGVEAKADVFRRDFRTRELAPRAAVVAGLMADEFDVEIDCLGCWRVYKPGQASCAAAA